MENKLKTVSFSPFIHCGDSVQKIMIDVIIATLPIIISSIYFFRLNALILLLTTIFSSVFFEWISRKIMKRYNSINDFSAIVTGILLALTLPPTTPIPIAILGSFVSIIIAKQFFGGIGYNIFNPALVGRGFILISFSNQLTTWIHPYTQNNYLDAIASSTPLNLTKEIFNLIYSNNIFQATNLLNKIKLTDLWTLFYGNCSGSIGETSTLAIIIGFVYLIIKKRINIEIPIFYIGTCFFISCFISLQNNLNILYPLIQILSGGLFLGAIFMATDPVTKPLNKKNRIIYSIGLGIITMIIRLKGNYPEGVLFSILIMNMINPFLNKHFKNKIFGKNKN